MTIDRLRAALVLVDLQNDFLPGGALAVTDGDAVLPLANRWQHDFDLVVATQDWHPANHVSFAANHPGKKVGDVVEVDGLRQELWPVHCVANTHGAALAGALETCRLAHVARKGTDPSIDSYSGFFDNGRKRSTGLAEYLQQCEVRTVYVLGLATDYCVKFTALDALRLRFRTVVLADACRGVNLDPHDSERAFAEMRAAGAEVCNTSPMS